MSVDIEKLRSWLREMPTERVYEGFAEALTELEQLREEIATLGRER